MDGIEGLLVPYFRSVAAGQGCLHGRRHLPLHRIPSSYGRSTPASSTATSYDDLFGSLVPKPAAPSPLPAPAYDDEIFDVVQRRHLYRRRAAPPPPAYDDDFLAAAGGLCCSVQAMNCDAMRFNQLKVWAAIKVKASVIICFTYSERTAMYIYTNEYCLYRAERDTVTNVDVTPEDMRSIIEVIANTRKW